MFFSSPYTLINKGATASYEQKNKENGLIRP